MEKSIEVKYEEFDSLSELTQEEREICSKALDVYPQAYAPYSQFYVGAALLLENGTIITGTNQENVAYPSGICAERTAMFYASSQHPNIKFKAIAVAANNKSRDFCDPVAPCGACRQVMAEYEQKFGRNISVLLIGNNGKILKVKSIKDLLPFMFEADELKKV